MLKKISLTFCILCVLVSSVYAKTETKSASGKAPGIALEDFNGQITMLGQLLAKNNIVLSFWSYDCVPCRKMVPVLDELEKEYAGGG